jgi:hypothetical protein
LLAHQLVWFELQDVALRRSLTLWNSASASHRGDNIARSFQKHVTCFGLEPEDRSGFPTATILVHFSRVVNSAASITLISQLAQPESSAQGIFGFVIELL